MLRVSVARLRTPDGEKYYLQRRHSNTRMYPGGLSFFGGQIEGEETPEECLRRELVEETSLDVGELALEHVASMSFLTPASQAHEAVEVHVFDALVHDAGFEVKEGAGAELHTLDQALAQPDLVPTTRYVLEQLEK